jgi:hypothetical protein
MYNSFIDENLAYKYSWEAKADYDNPVIITELDTRRLNRKEGYEMLYFIRSLAKTWAWQKPLTRSCRQLEKILKAEVPENIVMYAEIKAWLEERYEKL